MNVHDTNIKKHYLDLHNTINRLIDSGDISGPVLLIRELFDAWLEQNITQDESDEYSIDKHHTNIIYSTTRLMTDLVAIGEKWKTIQLLEERRDRDTDRAPVTTARSGS
ncbi:hypothetical protein [Spirosoma arcticum]